MSEVNIFRWNALINPKWKKWEFTTNHLKSNCLVDHFNLSGGFNWRIESTYKKWLGFLLDSSCLFQIHLRLKYADEKCPSITLKVLSEKKIRWFKKEIDLRYIDDLGRASQLSSEIDWRIRRLSLYVFIISLFDWASAGASSSSSTWAKTGLMPRRWMRSRVLPLTASNGTA